MLVKGILTGEGEKLAVVDHDAPLIAAARLLRDSTINLVVVRSQTGQMIGVITKTDVVARISECAGASCTTPAASVMTSDVLACRPEQPLSEVWTLMKARRLKRLPVADAEGRPAAVVSAHQVMEGLLKEVEREDELLRDYVMCVGYR